MRFFFWDISTPNHVAARCLVGIKHFFQFFQVISSTGLTHQCWFRHQLFAALKVIRCILLSRYSEENSHIKCHVGCSVSFATTLYLHAPKTGADRNTSHTKIFSCCLKILH